MTKRIAIVGGGAAGFFAALACAEKQPGAEIVILEKTAHFLAKVKISGGGRCNVTHACFNTREFTTRYPRGERELIAPFQQFSATATVAWFAVNGVPLKTEADGRMFPKSNTSQTVIDCLLGRARALGVKLRPNCGVESAVKKMDGGFVSPLSSSKGGEGRGEEALNQNSRIAPPNLVGTRSTASHSAPGNQGRGGTRPYQIGMEVHGTEGQPLPDQIPSPRPSPRSGGEREPEAVPGCARFELTLSNGETIECDQLLLAIGGCRTPLFGQLAVSLGHTLAAPVPSLFTFHVETPWLRELSGVAVELTEVSVPGTKLRERGALLATHWGLSGPAVLRLSAWGARVLAEKNYHFPLHVNWLPLWNSEKISQEFQARRLNQPARFVVNAPLFPLTSRMWEKLVVASGAPRDIRWSAFSSAAQHQLIQQLIRSEFPVTGKSLNKDEFVTCGGVPLREVNFKTMESRVCPGLFFAGEVLDLDGVTGGFNFQAAWTTGWIAGRAMAGNSAQG